jgi:Protein of unknown function (DUF1116)
VQVNQRSQFTAPTIGVALSLDIHAANALGLERLCAARPQWIGVQSAREALGLPDRTLLHAGPPIEWPRMCAPMRGAIVAMILFERWAATPDAAVQLADAGAIHFAPCHSYHAVGPMTGIISPSQPVIIVRDATHGHHAYSYMGEPAGPQVRMGSFAPENVARHHWIADELAPAFARALAVSGPLDLGPLMAQALAMGDEMHMRNAAGSALLVRAMAGPLAAVVDDRAVLERILRYMTEANDQFFLTWAMAAAKSAARSIEGLAGCTLVSAMARNGVEFGLRVAGLGDRWFTGPASRVAGSYFPGFSEVDANPDIGDSAIMETYGLGGMAMAGSPPVLRIVGAASFEHALATTRRMGEICVGENANFAIGPMNWQGSPTGIDVRRVVETGIVPSINTAIAHAGFGVGRMVGAGICTPPDGPFVAAVRALAEAEMSTPKSGTRA